MEKESKKKKNESFEMSAEALALLDEPVCEVDQVDESIIEESSRSDDENDETTSEAEENEQIQGSSNEKNSFLQMLNSDENRKCELPDYY